MDKAPSISPNEEEVEEIDVKIIFWKFEILWLLVEETITQDVDEYIFWTAYWFNRYKMAGYV